MRLIQTPAAQALIIRALTTDPSSEVRAAALFAIDYQPIGPFLAALATACQHDPDVSIRTGAVRQLARSLATTPATRTLLALVAEHDESPELRALTASLLAPHR